MGYTTTFTGSIKVEPPFTLEEYHFLISVADEDDSLHNQPDSYLQWKPSKTGDSLEWDGGEKFYDSMEWM